MRVRLIYPRPDSTNDVTYGHSPIVDHVLRAMNSAVAANIYKPGKRRFLVPPLNLMLIAGLMPSSVDVDIVDERATPIDFDEPVDLIGITAMTSDILRAYEIADEYRRRNIPVMIGGIHATVMPNEAILHADCVVIGEAEYLIDEIIADLRSGTLKTFYCADRFHDLKQLPHARRDLLDERDYITLNVLQTTRGCPHRCSFCSISLTAGLNFRCRPIPELLGEISSTGEGFLGFVDDNINGHPKYALNLFRALQPLNTRWYGDATILIAEDERLLDAAAASGCKVLLIGFESLSQQTLNTVHKRFNRPERFLDRIRRIHDRGIGIIGNFILGLDGDDYTEGRRIIEFVQEANLELAQIKILTPYPGTELFTSMDRQNRLLTQNWSDYDTSRGNVTFQPTAMSPSELQELYFRTNESVYSIHAILSRIPRMNYRTFFVPYNFRQRQTITEAKRRRVTPAVHMSAKGAQC